MYLNINVSLFKENIKKNTGSMWIAKNHGYGVRITEVWEIRDLMIFMVLRSCDHCQLPCSSCSLHFNPKASSSEDELEGVCPSLPKGSKTFHSPLGWCKGGTSFEFCFGEQRFRPWIWTEKKSTGSDRQNKYECWLCARSSLPDCTAVPRGGHYCNPFFGDVQVAWA